MRIADLGHARLKAGPPLLHPGANPSHVMSITCNIECKDEGEAMLSFVSMLTIHFC